jgi:hypothetical protein
MGIETAIAIAGMAATLASTVAPMVMQKKPEAAPMAPADKTPTAAEDNTTAQAAEAARRRKAGAQQGRSSTILTSALGEQASAKPTATLLGS